MAHAITREQVRQFESLLYRCGESLMRASDRVPDNGQGYVFFEKGDVRALLSTNPYAVWSTVAYGLTQADESTIDETIAFFRDHGVSPRVRIVPDGFTKQQAARLAKHNLRHSGFHTVMYAPLPIANSPGVPRVRCTRANSPHEAPANVTINHVTDPVEYDVALDTQIEGWGIPPVPDSPIKRIRRCWRELPEHRMYLAYVDGQPAAHAMMYVEGKIGYLENASTIPRFRNRGLHSALIQRRIADAASLGCDTILGAADFESPSRTNQMNAGLQIGYLASHWWEAEASK